MSTHKALVLEGVGAPFQVREVPSPAPGPGEAVVRVRAAALNHRDLWIRKGQYAGLKFPAVLGSDGAGEVESLGPGVDASWGGRKVVIHPGLDWGDHPEAQGKDFRILGMPDAGTFAQRVLVPARNLVAMPGHLSFEEAAALPLAGLTAYRALFTRGTLRAGEKVLLTGIGGGVALFLLRFALAAGAEVWVTSGSQEKISRAAALGARGGADYRAADWSETLSKEAGAFDLIVDSAGGPGFGRLCDLARSGGRLVFFGATAGNPPELALRKIFWRQLTLLGSTMGSPEDFAAMIRFVVERKLKPVLDESRPLERAEEAFARMDAAGQFGKLVLTMG